MTLRGLMRMVAKAAAGLLVLLAFAVAPAPVQASSQSTATHSPISLTHVSHGLGASGAVSQVHATRCSGPGCVDSPVCCPSASCSAAVGQLAASPAGLPAPLSIGSGAFLTVLVAPHAGTDATPAPPPPRPSI